MQAIIQGMITGPLPGIIGRYKKVIVMKKLVEKVMTEFVVLREKMYVYRKLDKKLECSYQKFKKCKKGVVVKSIIFDGYKTCLFKGEAIYKCFF